ncbi:hypothetical protein C2G38_2082709 [Gigaspora rosea]|uniref:Uncharacterized protein n=1 Tax=Gigaspora rosea TaxID=44941 RepID=A0A397VB01_9GLOM|nr:hypothetical protein C2G38_2082709 [Gigaspora rosea]
MFFFILTFFTITFFFIVLSSYYAVVVVVFWSFRYCHEVTVLYCCSVIMLILFNNITDKV